MPYAQPADSDKLFYSDFNVSWTFTSGSNPSVSSIVAPPGVQVVRIANGLYQIILPASYITQLNSAGTPITSAEFFCDMPGSSVAGTDVAYMLRYLPAAVGTSLSLGTFEFVAGLVSAAGVAGADVATGNTANVLCKLKFATVLVNAS